MTRLSLQDVKNLLGVQTINGTLGQQERLRKWIESLVAQHGNNFVLENRQSLRERWEKHMVLKTFDCC